MRSSKGAGTRNSSEWARCRALLALVKGKVRLTPFGQGVAGEKWNRPFREKTRRSPNQRLWLVAQKQRGPRRAMAATGPCFAARETTVMVQMMCRRRVRLAFAARRRGRWSTCFGTPFRSGMWGGDGASTLVAQSHSSGPAESWLPRLSAAPQGRRLLTSPSRLPVHDDAITLCRRGRGCQITNRALSDHSIR